MLSKLSIVVPVFNEVDNIIPLYESVCAALDDAPHEFELIMVDDGSDDGSHDRLKSLVTQDDRVKVIRLRRNFGQTIAMQTGIQTADGDVIVTMDGDLQNDPQDIPNLIAKIESGYDVVSGWRRDRKDHLFSRKIPSRIANWCIRKFLGIRVHDFGCDGLIDVAPWRVSRCHNQFSIHWVNVRRGVAAPCRQSHYSVMRCRKQ